MSEGKYTDIIKTEVQFKKMISVTEESDTENSEEADDVTHRRRYSDTSFKVRLIIPSTQLQCFLCRVHCQNWTRRIMK